MGCLHWSHESYLHALQPPGKKFVYYLHLHLCSVCTASTVCMCIFCVVYNSMYQTLYNWYVYCVVCSPFCTHHICMYSVLLDPLQVCTMYSVYYSTIHCITVLYIIISVYCVVFCLSCVLCSVLPILCTV